MLVMILTVLVGRGSSRREAAGRGNSQHGAAQTHRHMLTLTRAHTHACACKHNPTYASLHAVTSDTSTPVRAFPPGHTQPPLYLVGDDAPCSGARGASAVHSHSSSKTELSERPHSCATVAVRVPCSEGPP